MALRRGQVGSKHISAAISSAIAEDSMAVAILAADRESFVATRGQVCNGLTPASVQGQSSSYHVTHEDRDSIEAEFANWYVNATGQEVGPGAAATIECFISNPIGSTPVRVQFGGANEGSIPNGGSLRQKIVSKFKKGVPFMLFTYRTCASGVIYHAGGSALHLGEKGQFGAVVANTISTGVIGGSDYANYYAPVAIWGATRLRTVAILGDSIDDGVSGDLSNDFWGDRGVIAKALGKTYAYSCLAVAGDRANWFTTNNAKRKAIAEKASDIWIGYGRNDLGSGARTGAQLNGDMATIAALFPGLKLYTRTLLPWSTSSDNWATQANQTAAPEWSHANTANVERLKRLAPWVYCADLFTIASSRNGPFTPTWKVDPSLAVARFFTPDGTHPNERCCDAIARSGLVRLV